MTGISSTDLTGFRSLLAEELPLIETAFEGDENYDDARAAWNIRTRYMPVGVVRPTSTEEVQAVIRCARRAGIGQVVMRSGGHSFEGSSLGGADGRAIVIDMIRMNRVTIDPDQQVATVEGGALTGHISTAAWQHGLMIPTGDCVAIGVAGQIQCGGYGQASSRPYGCLVDRVEQLEVVTADGEVLIADDTRNTDLYWALRGSGNGSFGVITKLKIRLNEPPRAVAHFDFRWALSDLNFDSFQTVFSALQDYCLNASLTVGSIVEIWLGRLQVEGAIMADTVEERHALIEDMRARLMNIPGAPAPTLAEIKPQPFIDTVRDIGLTTSAPWYPDLSKIVREGTEHSRFMKLKSGFITDPFTTEFIRDLSLLSVAQPSVGCRIQLVAMTGSPVPEVDTTSIKVRKSSWMMGMAVWLESEGPHDDSRTNAFGEALVPWIDAAYELFYPYSAGPYTGDEDVDEAKHGRDLYNAYFGTNLPKLKDVKRKYDPANLFHHQFSIPLD